MNTMSSGHLGLLTIALIMTEKQDFDSRYRVVRVVGKKVHRFHFVDIYSGKPAFPNQFYEEAQNFSSGYAVVVIRGKSTFIDEYGKITTKWRFTDASDVNVRGCAMVQHPRAFGWSLFNVQKGVFLTNKPRYRR